MRPEYTPEVFDCPKDVWDMTKVENWVIKPISITKQIVDAYKFGENVIMENKKVEVAEVTDGNEEALVNLKGLGQAIGDMLKDAVEKATTIALEKGNKPIQVVLGDGKEVKRGSFDLLKELK